ncbi:MAG: hypothetical protein Q3987_01270 [Oscillospiraceae bacterium]|nr:hypothetical protein [Oscillospiraceae bacterium]
MTLKEFNELMKANNVPEDTVLMCHSEYDMRPVLLKGVYFREFDNTLLVSQENRHGYDEDVGFVGLNPNYFITTKLSKGRHFLCFEEIDYLRKNDKNRYHFVIDQYEETIDLEDCTFAEFFSYIKAYVIGTPSPYQKYEDTFSLLKDVYKAACLFEIV